jgi:hypothetical protein
MSVNGGTAINIIIAAINNAIIDAVGSGSGSQ